jgi:hypothetical protein
MNIDAFWSAVCRFIIRSALDIAAFWIARYYYLRWRGEVEDAQIDEDLRLEVPLGPGEDMDTFGQRKQVLGSVWHAIWIQQKYVRGGQECKQWFLDEIQNLSISFTGMRGRYRERSRGCLLM